jgi:hypothetical protein
MNAVPAGGQARTKINKITFKKKKGTPKVMKVLKTTGNRRLPGAKMRAAMTVTGGGTLNVSHLRAVLAWRG